MSLLDYPGDWYTQQYMRQNGPGDLYDILLEEKSIPVTFYSNLNFDADCRNEEFKDVVDYLNERIGSKIEKEFFFNGQRDFMEPSWNYHGLQILVHTALAPKQASGRYFGQGIIGIHPQIIHRKDYATVLHEFGHGLFGYGHHPRRINCIMGVSLITHFAARICEEDMQTVENLKNGKKLERRIA